jgi:hypothetical protein
VKPFLRQTPPLAPQNAAGNSIRRESSAQTTRSLTRGPGPISHAAGAPASECGEGEPPHTTARRFETAAGKYLNWSSGNEAPRAWPDGTARHGAMGQSAAGADVEIDVTEGILTKGTSAGALKWRPIAGQAVSRQDTSFGPTCRLASSPEVGPGATVGTPKHEYPLLLYEDVVPTRLYLSRVAMVLRVGPRRGSPQPRATTLGPQQRLTHHTSGFGATTCPGKVICAKTPTVSPDPHGSAPDLWVYSQDPQGWSGTSTSASRTPGIGSGPLCVGSGPLTVGSQNSRTENTQTLVKTQVEVQG